MNNKLYHAFDEYEAILEDHLVAIEEKLFAVLDCASCGKVSFDKITSIITGAELLELGILVDSSKVYFECMDCGKRSSMNKEEFIKKLKEEV